MTRAVLSLGSNLGASAALLFQAVRSLGATAIRVSSVYRTPPWGPVAQDDFLNIAVLAGDPHLDAHGWLDRCHELERAAHRERLVRWGPRTLDADVVGVWNGAGDGPNPAAGDPHRVWREKEAVVSNDPMLTLPHPRAFERAFVLLPWTEIQPDAVLPGHGPIRDLLAQLDVAGIDRIGPLAPSDDRDQWRAPGVMESVDRDRPGRGASLASIPAPDRRESR